MKSVFMIAWLFVATVGVILIETEASAEENAGRLSQLKETYQVVTTNDVRRLIQGFHLNVDQRIGDSVVRQATCVPFEGVRYRLGKDKKDRVIATVTVRVYSSCIEALDDMLTKYGGGYAERPRKGCHAGDDVVGDLSLVTSGSLVFVRRNVMVSVINLNNDTAEVDRIGKAIVETVDETAAASGKKAIDAPEIGVAFRNTHRDNVGSGMEVLLTVPKDLQFVWDVRGPSRKAIISGAKAFIPASSVTKTTKIVISIATRDGFVSEKTVKK